MITTLESKTCVHALTTFSVGRLTVTPGGKIILQVALCFQNVCNKLLEEFEVSR